MPPRYRPLNSSQLDADVAAVAAAVSRRQPERFSSEKLAENPVFRFFIGNALARRRSLDSFRKRLSLKEDLFAELVATTPTLNSQVADGLVALYEARESDLRFHRFPRARLLRAALALIAVFVAATLIGAALGNWRDLFVGAWPVHWAVLIPAAWLAWMRGVALSRKSSLAQSTSLALAAARDLDKQLMRRLGDEVASLGGDLGRGCVGTLLLALCVPLAIAGAGVGAAVEAFLGSRREFYPFCWGVATLLHGAMTALGAGGDGTIQQESDALLAAINRWLDDLRS